MTALVPTGWPVTPAYYRDRPGLTVAIQLAFAYNEGAYVATRRMVEGRVPYEIEHRIAQHMAPGYHEIRNYLVGECEIDERLAQRAAFMVDTSNQRHMSILKETTA